MNPFDLWIMHFINSFANRSWNVDATVVMISNNGLLIGAVLVAMYWWAWMEPGREVIGSRESLVVSLFLATPIAVLSARLLATSLPYRERPLHNPLVQFHLPYTMYPDTLLHWSSFPSDHAVLCFCLAAGLWMVSRRLGVLAISYAALINLPRIYCGIHYPTDILAGALVGIGFAFLTKVPWFRAMARISLNYLGRRPGYLYFLLFVWTFEIAEMFGSLYGIGLLGVKIALKCPRWEIEAFFGPLLLTGLLGVLGWLSWRKHHPLIEPREPIGRQHAA
jgi:undecaprenyl-diphosphatase